MGLIVIGIIASFRTLIIPILVFSIIFLLYKFPPGKWAQLFSNRNSKKPKRKNAKFRVIQGNKGDDDDRPPYH